jgi:RNA polymerase sigma factor (sigma-70 family)
MKNTPYEGYLGRRMTTSEAKRRISRVVAGELSDVEREVLVAYYLREMKIPEIARERGVNKSSVCRALHRAEEKLRKYLKY